MITCTQFMRTFTEINYSSFPLGKFNALHSYSLSVVVVGCRVHVINGNDAEPSMSARRWDKQLPSRIRINNRNILLKIVRATTFNILFSVYFFCQQFEHWKSWTVKIWTHSKAHLLPTNCHLFSPFNFNWIFSTNKSINSWFCEINRAHKLYIILGYVFVGVGAADGWLICAMCLSIYLRVSSIKLNVFVEMCVCACASEWMRKLKLHWTIRAIQIEMN